jgi:predicted component of type VI protein secretion system
VVGSLETVQRGLERLIEQTGANGAVVVQMLDESRVSIVQTGEGNLAVIVQQ